MERKEWPKEGADCKTMLDISLSLIECAHYLGLSISHRNEMNRIAFYSKVGINTNELMVIVAAYINRHHTLCMNNRFRGL